MTPAEDKEVDDVMEQIEKRASERLNDWEASFMDSLRNQWDETRSLSPRQKAKLDQIFEKYIAA